MAAYLGFIQHEEGRSFGAFFPDFPGCVSGGDTLEEALSQAPRGLRFHVETMQADGDAIPAPSPFARLAAAPEYQGLLPFVVDLPVEKSKAVRLNITIEERLAKEIDTYAVSIGKTRSAFLADAARMAMRS